METNWLDWIVIVILLAGLGNGFAKGFFGMLFGLAGYVVSLYLAFAFSASVADVMESTFGLQTRILGYVQEAFPDLSAVGALFAVGDVALEAGGFENGIGAIIASFLVRAIAFLVIFIIAKMAITLVGGLLGSAVSVIPGLSFLNRLGGAGLGLMESALLVLLLLTIFQPVAAAFPAVTDAFEKSRTIAFAGPLIDIIWPWLLGKII